LINFGETEIDYAFMILDKLRSLEVRTELYPDAVKLKKQFSYADSRKIPYILMAGEDEIKNNSLTIKNMSTGEQGIILINDLENFVRDKIKYL
jgi:histidyl-tRNA synthetase